jgi:hypothetical protein
MYVLCGCTVWLCCVAVLCRYWELVETVRRLVLTAVLSVCAPGTSAQAVFSLLISLFYIKVYGFYAPYANRQDSVLAETGQFQVFLTFFGALIVQNALLPAFWSSPLGVLLIAMNLSVLYYTLYVELRHVFKREEGGGADTTKATANSSSPDPPAPCEEGEEDASSTDWGDVEMCAGGANVH